MKKQGQSLFSPRSDDEAASNSTPSANTPPIKQSPRGTLKTLTKAVKRLSIRSSKDTIPDSRQSSVTNTSFAGLSTWVKMRPLKHTRWKKVFARFHHDTGLQWFPNDDSSSQASGSIASDDLVGVAEHKEKGSAAISVIQRNGDVTLLKITDSVFMHQTWLLKLNETITRNREQNAAAMSEEDPFSDSMNKIMQVIREDPEADDGEDAAVAAEESASTPRVNLEMLDEAETREEQHAILRELLLQEKITEEDYSLRFRRTMGAEEDNGAIAAASQDSSGAALRGEEVATGSAGKAANADQDIEEGMEEFAVFHGMYADESKSLVKLFEVGDQVRGRDGKKFVTGTVEWITEDALFYVVRVEGSKRRLLCGPNDVLRVDMKQRKRNQELLSKQKMRLWMIEEGIKSTSEAYRLAQKVRKSEKLMGSTMNTVEVQIDSLKQLMMDIREQMKRVAASAVHLSNAFTTRTGESQDDLVDAEETFRVDSEELFTVLERLKEQSCAELLGFEEVRGDVSTSIDALLVASEEAMDMGESIDRETVLDLRHSLAELLSLSKTIIEEEEKILRNQAVAEEPEGQSAEALLKQKLHDLKKLLEKTQVEIQQTEAKLL